MKSRSLIAAAIVLAVVLIGAVGGYYVVQWRARNAVEAMLAQLPPGTVGQVADTHYDILNRTLTVHGVTLSRQGKPWLDVARVVVERPRGAGTTGDPWTATAIVLDEMSGHAADVPAHVRRATGRDVVALRASADADASLARLDAGKANIRLLHAAAIEVDALDAAQGSFDSLHMRDLHGGHVAGIQVVNLRLKDVTGTTSIGGVDADDVDLDGLDAAFGGGKAAADPAVNGAVSGRRLLIGHATIRQLSTGTADAPGDRVAQLDLAGFKASPPTPGLDDELRQWGDVLIRSAFDSLRLSGVDLQSSGAATLEDGTAGGRLTFGSMEVGGYDDGKLATFAFGDMGFVSNLDGSSLGARQLQMSDLDFSQALKDAVTSGRGGLGLIARSSKIGHAVIEQFSYRSSVAAQPVAIAHVEARNSYGADNSVQSSMTVRNLVFAVPSSTGDAGLAVPPMVRELLGPKADLDLDLAYAFTPADHNLDIDHLRVTLKDAGSLALSARLAGADFDAAAAQSDNPTLAGLTLLQETSLVEATLRFDNQSLVQRIIDRAAKDNGMEPDEVRQGIRRQLPILDEYLPWQPDAVDQAEAFINRPRALTITITPPEPVPLLDVASMFVEGTLDPLQPRLKAN